MHSKYINNKCKSGKTINLSVSIRGRPIGVFLAIDGQYIIFLANIFTFTFQIKSNQITFIVTSPQHKCLGEWNSYERAPDSAEKQQTIYIWTDSAKKQQTIYLWTDSAKKQQTIYIWTDSAKKLHWSIYSAPDSAKKNNNNLHMDRQCKKKKQQQFTYGQYIFTDCTEDNVQNTHTFTQYA